MGSWGKQARVALSNKNFVQAGDFYKLDGNYRAAIKAYIKGKQFAEAAKIYESLGKERKAQKLLQKNGSQKDLAEFFMRHGHPEKAIDIFMSNGMEFDAASLLERNNQYAAAAEIYGRLNFHEKAGVLYGMVKDYDRAIDMFNRVLVNLRTQSGPTIKSQIFKYLDRIANLHLGAKRYNEAGIIFEKINVKEKAAKSFIKGENFVKAAELFIQLGQISRAKSVLNGVESVEARALLGQVAMDEGRFNDAVELLRETDQTALLCRANEHLGRFREAAEGFEKLGKVREAAAMYSRAKDYQKAAIIFEQQGCFEEAAENYAQLEKFDLAAKLFQLAGNKYQASHCLHKLGRNDEALQLIQELPAGHPNHLEITRLKADIFFKLGKFTVARTLLEELTTDVILDDKSLYYFYLLARCLEEERQYASAQKYYERILALRVGFADVDFRLRRLSEKHRNRGEQTVNTLKEDASPYDLTQGDLIAERFRILQTIGKGGMGFIFKVRDLSLNRDIALKMLIHERGNFEELKAELITARDLTHAYIIKVFDIGEWMGVGYFTMEFVEGVPLKNFIHTKKDLPIEDKVRLLVRICEGLKAAHDQGVVHRDIKPQNIIIDGQSKPKVLDFGIARRVTQNRRDTSVSGSPKYMAPEQIRNLSTDMRTDIYALGIIMFYMFTLREPFIARTAQEIMLMQLERQLPDPSRLNPNIPFWLVEIIQRCCNKRPDMRFNSMGELIEELKLNLLDLD